MIHYPQLLNATRILKRCYGSTKTIKITMTLQVLVIEHIFSKARKYKQHHQVGVQC